MTIEVKNLTKRYGQNKAVDDISFEIKEGEIVGFLGPNGAGKTTTMNILTGYLSASEGIAKIGGKDILEEPFEVKKMIGYLPEQPPLYHQMTVLEYLNFIYDLKRVKLPREEHIESICKLVRIDNVAKRVISNLSKGYKQRVGIAQALVGDPKLIVFDEPTVGLDPKQILEIRNLLRTLAKNHTVILSTHILAEVQAVCERVIIINQGKIIADEKTAELTKVIEDGYQYEVKICGPAKEVVTALEGVLGVKSVTATGTRDADSYAYIVESEKGVDVRKPLFNLCAKKSWAILGLSPVGTDLESIFIRLVDRANGIEPARKPKRKVH